MTDMETTPTIDAELLRQMALRLERAGLVIDRTTLSPAHRRVFFTWQIRAASTSEQPEAKRAAIGFAYPNAK
jgi:hypothetical protein